MMKENQKLTNIKPDAASADVDSFLAEPIINLHCKFSADSDILWQEFATTLKEASKTSFMDLLHQDAGLRQFLMAVFSLSPYLRELSLKFPSTVASCCEKGFERSLQSVLESMNVADGEIRDEAVVMRRLRIAKKQAALICGLADLGGWWTASQVGAGISDTADKALCTAVRHLLLVAHDGGKITLQDIQNPEEDSGYIVLAMGKHGARELNYSSDIDLIVFFDPESPAIVDRDESVVLFGRITRSLVRIMQDLTEDGYVFRTDLRLRPDPGSMPVAIPVGLAMHYYESRGQNWERAALIKARVVAGDAICGRQILDELKPFVWRRYLDYAAIADVHSIKRQIQTHKGYTSLSVPGHNVKLGRGGIREIEFFVQTQQLIAGGRATDLRGRQTLAMLRELSNHGWVEPEVSGELQESYLYLRDVEHRLQMVGDEQTHTIPETDDAFDVIVRMSGFETSDQFQIATLEHLKRVEGHYSNLFALEPELAGKLGNLSFTGDDDDPGTVETLGQLGFARPSDIIAIIRGWHFGRHRAMQTVDARERLTEITPALLECFSDTGNPDEALIAFDSFLKGLPAGFQLFNLLKANPHLLNLLVMVLGVAPRLASIITRRPHVFDGLLEPNFFDTEVTAEVLDERFGRILGSVVDYQDGLDRARQFAAEHRFLIGIRVLAGALKAKEAGRAYSLLADCMLRSMLRFVQDEFEKQHGVVPNSGIAIVGMGNLGTRELTAGSDLDLIVLYEYDESCDTSTGTKPLHASQYFGRLTQRLISAMSAPTAEGLVYELDFRLRPSGNSGPLATTLRSFLRYHEEESWTWEHLALTRGRVLFADDVFASKVQAEMHKMMQAKTAGLDTASEVLKMRHLMDKERPPQSIWDVKLAKGGLVDLEFMAQWAVLSGSIAETKSTRQALEKMVVPHGFSRDDLLEAFDCYTAIIQISRICLSEIYAPDNAQRGLTERLLKELDFPDLSHAEAQLTSMQKTVREAFEKMLHA